MTIATLIKAGFGILAACLYAAAAYFMIDGALSTATYAPGEGVEYVITLCGAAITAFVAAQLGIAVGAGPTNDDGSQRNLIARLDRDDDSSGRVTAAVLVFDAIVLVVVGALFVWLYLDPASIEVADGAKELTIAPDYVSLQAKAFIALVIAGAGGVGVAAAK